MQPRQSRRPLRLIFIAGLVLILSVWAYRNVFAASAESSKGAPGSPGDSWHMKMNEISALLGELGPFIYSESAFKDSANRRKIEQLTSQLSGLAHQIELKAMVKESKKKTPSEMKAPPADGTGAALSAPDADPTLVFLSEQFNDSLKRAEKGFKEGHTDYARALLRTTVSYCIFCHTRSAAAENKPQSGFNDFVADLSPSEQIRFFAATRQFDRVTEAFEKAFSAGKDARLSDLESAARIALSIAVRVKNDLTEAAKIARRVTDHPSAPASLKDEAKVWIKAIDLWKKEAADEPSSNEALLASARELVIQAQVLQQYPTDGRGDVAYLKASSLLHELLKRSPTEQMKADALYYTGICYEALRDLGFWTLHENYYEACIRTRPHSARAEVCFARLNDSLTLGYTGTRGTDVPPDIRRFLSGLKTLAKPSSASPK